MLHDLGGRDLKDRWRDLRLALLYKIVTGHVAINPDQIGLVAADNRTRANGFQSTRTLTKSYHANSYPSQLEPNTTRTLTNSCLLPTRTQTMSYPIPTRTQLHYVHYKT